MGCPRGIWKQLITKQVGFSEGRFDLEYNPWVSLACTWKSSEWWDAQGEWIKLEYNAQKGLSGRRIIFLRHPKQTSWYTVECFINSLEKREQTQLSWNEDELLSWKFVSKKETVINLRTPCFITCSAKLISYMNTACTGPREWALRSQRRWCWVTDLSSPNFSLWIQQRN